MAPKARVFNYTNPVNILAQAVTLHTDVEFASFCEGPIIYTQEIAESAGLDFDDLDTAFSGLNHGSWSVRHLYRGEDAMPLIRAAWERQREGGTLEPKRLRQLHLAALMGAIPSEYFMYYYFSDEIVEELQAKPTTRAEDILASVPGYWQHYEEQLERDRPELDPDRSRGGIHELELAIDAMDAVFNDRGEVLPVNVPNRGRAVPDLGEEVVVEVPGRCGADWIEPLPQPPAAPPRPRPRRDAGGVPGAGGGGRLERHPRGRRAGAGREPAGALDGEGRAAVRRARRGTPRAPAGAVGRVILGVDGGNTKTLAVVARPDGELVAAARGGQSDLYNAPSVEVAVAELYRAVFEALDRAGVEPSELRGAGLSLAGADWDEDFEVHRAAVERALPGVPASDRERRDRPDPRARPRRAGGLDDVRHRRGDRRARRGRQRVQPRLHAALGQRPRPGPRGARGGPGGRHGRRAADRPHAPHPAGRRRARRARAGARVQPPRRPDRRRLARAARAGGGRRGRRGRDRDRASSSAAAWVAGRATPRGRSACVGAFRLLMGGGLLRQPGSDALVCAPRWRSSPDADAVRLEAEPVLGALLLGFDAAGLEVDEVGLLERHPSELIC